MFWTYHLVEFSEMTQRLWQRVSAAARRSVGTARRSPSAAVAASPQAPRSGALRRENLGNR